MRGDPLERGARWQESWQVPQSREKPPTGIVQGLGGDSGHSGMQGPADGEQRGQGQEAGKRLEGQGGLEVQGTLNNFTRRQR